MLSCVLPELPPRTAPALPCRCSAPTGTMPTCSPFSDTGDRVAVACGGQPRTCFVRTAGGYVADRPCANPDSNIALRTHPNCQRAPPR